MPSNRNGVPTPSGGAVRTAERTGKIPVERTGGNRPRQARPNPAGGQGPFDVDDADPRVSSAPGVLDFGALRVPVPPAGQVTVEPSANGRMQAVHVNLAGGRLSVSALAAPKSSKLWPQLAKEIDASLREGGARVRSHKGEWGRELHATTGAATSVFVGVDGPRWMIYGVATGPTGESPELDAELRRLLRGTVVVRGKSPYPVRTVLPLTTPEELGGADEPVTTAVPTTPPPAPPPPPPAPDRRRPPVPPPVEEPSWADPVQRIADDPEAEVLPEGDDAAAATGLATSAWPVDERTGRPRAPEWTGEQRVPPRRRKAPAVAEVAAAITEPIFIGAVMGEPPAHPEPVREAPRRARNRPAEVDAPATTRLPVVPEAAPPDTGEPGRAESGIDAYFGWDRTARPEPAPAPERPVPERSARERPAPERPAPVDPLDPSAPVDTRWLDEPGITTAWESVTAGLAAQAERPAPELPEPARREPERAEPAREREPAPAAGQDWAEWARQELDRAVSGRAGTTEPEPAPSSFWDRYGLQEPSTGGRAARRHGSGPEDEPVQQGPDSRDDEIDPFTARRRSRQAVRGEDPDAPAQPRRSADPADVTELPPRTGRVHHLTEPGVAELGAEGSGRSARTSWEDMSASRAPGLNGGDDGMPRSRAGGAESRVPTDRGGRGPESEPDAWTGGPHPFASPDRGGRGTGGDAAPRSGWADLSRAVNAIGRADAERTSGDDWAGLTGSVAHDDPAAHSGPSGTGRRADPLGSEPSRPAERQPGIERGGSADPFGRLDRPERAGSSGPAARPDRTQERRHRATGESGRSDRPLPRRTAEPPAPSPWAPAPSPWSAASSGASGTAGWTTGWPGTGSSGRRAEEPARAGHDQPAAEPASGGRRRAEDSGERTRLSVAELAQRAALEASTTRRSRHTRPGGDREG